MAGLLGLVLVVVVVVLGVPVAVVLVVVVIAVLAGFVAARGGVDVGMVRVHGVIRLRATL